MGIKSLTPLFFSEYSILWLLTTEHRLTVMSLGHYGVFNHRKLDWSPLLAHLERNTLVDTLKRASNAARRRAGSSNVIRSYREPDWDIHYDKFAFVVSSKNQFKKTCSMIHSQCSRNDAKWQLLHTSTVYAIMTETYYRILNQKWNCQFGVFQAYLSVVIWNSVIMLIG